MSTTDGLNKKSGNHHEALLDEHLEGTSARTRPLSFDDIMCRRKTKGGTAKQIADGSGIPDIALSVEIHEKAPHSLETDKKKDIHSVNMVSRHTSNESLTESTRREKDANLPSKDEKVVQGKYRGSQDTGANSKVTAGKHVGNERLTSGKNEGHRPRNRNKDGIPSDDFNNGSDMRRTRDLVGKGKVSERPRVKSEINREQRDNGEGHLYRKRKIDDQKESESEKRNAKDVMRTEKLSERHKDRFENENRHKRHTEVDNTRGRSDGKKHNYEKRVESKRVYLEESRSKRRRSLSADREKERGRKSPAHSPNAHKHTSKDKREHEELSLHSAKDRAGREHSDVDKKRTSNNGTSSHYKRNAGSASGLGGYSPRKRKSDTAAKTPSPTRHSPDRRTAGWDLPPVRKESSNTVSTTSSQVMPSDVKELPSGIPMTPTVVKPVGISHHTMPSQLHAIESIQLTQATRPLRRVYVENLPASASEKDLMESINKILLSSGTNYIQGIGTQPCISCIINKEKGQALLEFLTPEHASAALSYDGIFFSGSNLKLRRPKDYADVTTGLDDKSVVAVDSVCDIVEDSPHKIFIGRIPKSISSEMLLEITRAFGPVKAYHFEFNADSNEQHAFLEYVDHTVSSKACAGINGMRLGGQVITAAFATPHAVPAGNVGKPHFYGIPDHAKSLLKKPTAVLKLKDVLDPEGLLALSESELEEILEDIRLECSRFGTVKSVNVAKPSDPIYTTEANETNDTNASTDGLNLEIEEKSHTTKQLGECINGLGDNDRLQPSENLIEIEDNCSTAEDKKDGDSSVGIPKMVGASVETLVLVRLGVVGDSSSDYKDESLIQPSDGRNSSAEDPSSQEHHDGFTGNAAQQSASVGELESSINNSDSNPVSNIEIENKPLIVKEEKLEETNEVIMGDAELKGNQSMDASEEGDKKNLSAEFGDLFEPGSVFVEYRRAEAACMAAHCLHGRAFDGRVVTVEYVSHDLYQMKFRR